MWWWYMRMDVVDVIVSGYTITANKSKITGEG